MRLNDLDERIVHTLAEDARRSYADIGAIVGLSAPAVKRRVDRLRAEGAITGFTVRVDPAALGWETEGFIEIYCSRNTSPDAIKQGLARYPEIASASTVTGEADAVVQVFAADMRHFEQVLERIAGEPYVERTKSVLVLSPLLRRYSAEAPLPEAVAYLTWLTCGDAGRNDSPPHVPPAQRIDGRCATLAPCPGRSGPRTFDTSPHPARTARGQPCRRCAPPCSRAPDVPAPSPRT